MENKEPNIYNLAKSNFKNYQNSGFRKFQREAIQFAVESQKKIVVIEAATGSGKSLLGMTSLAASAGGAYLVHSKVLQNQITADFPEAESLFGRANYPCIAAEEDNQELTCGDCFHTKLNPCKYKKHECVYDVRKEEVLSSRFKILNYDYYLSEINYVGRFSGDRVVVIDEADSLENTLINFTTLVFTKYALARIGMADWASGLKMTSKFKDDLVSSWKEFGEEAAVRVDRIVKKINHEIESFGSNIGSDQLRIIKEQTKIIRLQERIKLFLDNVDDTWILDNQDDRLIFRPLWMTPNMAEKYLWRHASKFILMSASFYPRNILAKCLGLDMDDIDYFNVPSQFPIANRPVYIHPAANLTSKTIDTEFPKLLTAIREIVQLRPNVKGICHAVSYSLAHKIVDEMKDPRFITHNSSDRQDVLNKFIESKEPLILVSPSLERGVSLEEDKCRLVIIAKAPYLYLGDKIVSARLYTTKQIGNEWYKATMLLTVLQMAGRGVRSNVDYAETFILDEQVRNTITSHPGFLPDWWLDALEFRLPVAQMEKPIQSMP